MQLFLYTLTAQISRGDLPAADFGQTLAKVLRLVFVAAALISVIFVAYGGFKYTISNGDPQGIKSAKDTILAAIIGLVLAVSAFTLVGFVAGNIK